MLDIFDMWSISDHWWDNQVNRLSSWYLIVKRENPTFPDPWF
jgi:hypothetical protein